ncbi:hypothetical protein TREES_T100015003 [Tupaia chinensis]|uniref:Uncharacterized protein n=1 Tax=Tupaia chinensis TaxID=246437 RepID=L9KLW4_TUPCH|nr:hypothetical protein TREES_T100015003 [Tupaia chinensis]
MSSQGSPSVESSTTTISSVAVQAGDSKIVIAVIKCGKWVQLQLAESQPNLLEIGSNQDETRKLLHDHELLLAKLKKNRYVEWCFQKMAVYQNKVRGTYRNRDSRFYKSKLTESKSFDMVSGNLHFLKSPLGGAGVASSVPDVWGCSAAEGDEEGFSHRTEQRAEN